MLAVVETHPIQYHAPIYQMLQARFGIPVTAIYGSDFSVAGYHDPGFGATFAWDTDLLSGYTHKFLSMVAESGARSVEEVSAKGLWKILREVAPKAVLVGGYGLPFNQLTLLTVWRAGYPILFRGETTDSAQERGRVKDFARKQVLQRLYQHCHKLLYIGQNSYSHYKSLGCADEKLIFSPYCVATDAFQMCESSRLSLRPATRESLGITDKQVGILFSGKLSNRKGPDLLLQAVKRMESELRERIVVMFLGSGALEKELKELARQEPAVEAVWLGFQNQSQISRYYHAADLLVLPSRRSETWGLVVNDALHHGLPCVVSKAVGCAPDLIHVGRTGEVFEIDSAESLISALQRAIELVGRYDVREQCRQKMEGYTVEKAAEGIANAYRAVAE